MKKLNKASKVDKANIEYREGSIASKANLVQQYNKTQKKK